MRKLLTYLFLILILFLLVAIFIVDYWYFKNFYHSLIIIGIIVTNINLYIQGQHAKILYTAIKRWLRWN